MGSAGEASAPYEMIVGHLILTRQRRGEVAGVT